MARHAAEEGIAEAALDLLELPVLALDESRCLLYLNRAAKELVEQGCWTVRRGDVLQGRDRATQADLDRLLATVRNDRCGGGLFSRPRDRRHLHILAVPAGTRTLLIVFDSVTGWRWSDTVLAEVLGLTPAEARLAQSLMAGRTLAQHARSARIAKNTVRSQLRHILAKTGAPRQVELASLLARLAPSGTPPSLQRGRWATDPRQWRLREPTIAASGACFTWHLGEGRMTARRPPFSGDQKLRGC